MTRTAIRLLVPCAAAALAACAAPSPRDATLAADAAVIPIESRLHHDDLLTGGLGLAGLRNPVPPPFADAQRPTAEEKRRRALWTNWRGIADLASGGGYGEWYGTLEPQPGTEVHGWMTVPGATQPHRVMVHVPDNYDAGRRCLVVAPSSGSRGIHGAIALAGAWGLPRGCAVAYTDKGAGTDWEAHGDRVDFKHAHSRDNPEADWGRHVRQAAEFGAQVLGTPLGELRVIAAGLSNGAGAVLRAAEQEGDWLDGVVAIAPNVLPPDGGRALYDYATEAALLQPCALLDARFDHVALARPGGASPPASLSRCASLRAAGLVEGDEAKAQAASALATLHAGGWTDAAIEAGAISVAFDLWRAVAGGYAFAYTRSAGDAGVCGYSWGALDAQGSPRAATPEEQAAWWSDASGIPPGAGVQLRDANAVAGAADPAFAGLQCLRALWQSREPLAVALREGVAATRAGMPRAGLPVFVVHGADDGLVPEAFSGGAYARATGVPYWRVDNAQHFDAFLGLPPLATRYVPLLPYAYRALDAMWSHVVDGAPLPASARLPARRRAAGAAGIEPLTAAHLALP